VNIVEYCPKQNIIVHKLVSAIGILWGTILVILH